MQQKIVSRYSISLADILQWQSDCDVYSYSELLE